MYHFLEGSVVVTIAALVLWVVAFGVTLDGNHYELSCPESACHVTVQHREVPRLSLARRAIPRPLASVPFGAR